MSKRFCSAVQRSLPCRLLLLLVALVACQQHETIIEQVLYEDIKQEQRTWKYYKMQVSRRYWDGATHLVWKVMAD